MSLTLYYHPLASYCQKVLLALYEGAVPFKPRLINLGDVQDRTALAALWPWGKFPVLRDEGRGRTVPESSVVIEYLARHFAGASALLPEDPDARSEVRLWDRVFDGYVHAPMQQIVADSLRPTGERDARGVAEARAALHRAYALLDRHLEQQTWAASPNFSMADCAAMPALFYAAIVAPIPERHGQLLAYFERLMQRASAQRVLREAQPYFSSFPLHDAIPERFLLA